MQEKPTSRTAHYESVRERNSIDRKAKESRVSKEWLKTSVVGENSQVSLFTALYSHADEEKQLS